MLEANVTENMNDKHNLWRNKKNQNTICYCYCKYQEQGLYKLLLLSDFHWTNNSNCYDDYCDCHDDYYDYDCWHDYYDCYT